MARPCSKENGVGAFLPIPSMSRKTLAEMMNRSVYADRLEGHWAETGVKALTAALYDADPMGLRGFGLPRNEYEGEAVLAFALAFDHVDADAFLAAREAPNASCEKARGRLVVALSESFKRLFDHEIHFEDNDPAVRVMRNAFMVLQHVPE